MRALRQHVERRFPGAAYQAGVGAGRRDITEWVMMDQFNSSYFSGLDVSFYFGAVLMDEVISMQYQEIEQVRPNYGYADFTFRSVSRGSRVVQGTFTINFKESMYVQQLLTTLRNEQLMEFNLQRLEGDMTPKDASRLTGASVVKQALSGDFTLEDFVAMQSSPEHLYRQAEFSIDNKFGDVMDDLDASIWGKSTKFNEKDVIKKTDSETKRGVDLDHVKFRGPSGGFDITIKYGQPEDFKPGQPRWGTVEMIRGCHISGVSKAIDDSGKNVIESYNFIGQSVE